MKKVVIIGGGFAGSLIAQKLEKDFAITLIDSKNYFEFTPGILRTIVEPNHWKKIRVLHRTYLRKTKLIVSSVSDVTSRSVSVGRNRIEFDYLVICSGSGYSLPIKEAGAVLPIRARHLVDSHARLERANRILIVGGGLVGVELAGEIVTHYSGKKVTLVHAHDMLMERNMLRSRRYVAQFLREHHVELIYNERVVKKNGNSYVTDSGREIPTDLAFFCTGITPNFEFLRPHLSSLLNENNQVRVNEYLQVIGHDRIFAAGDITNCAVEKTAQNAELQAMIVVKNICAFDHGKKLYAYLPKKTPQVINLGKWDGILETQKGIITGLAPALLKSAIERREMWRRGAWHL